MMTNYWVYGWQVTQVPGCIKHKASGVIVRFSKGTPRQKELRVTLRDPAGAEWAGTLAPEHDLVFEECPNPALSRQNALLHAAEWYQRTVMGMPEMTPEQFECCSPPNGKAGLEAARLVLVEGWDAPAAAEKAGVTAQSVRNVVFRVRKLDAKLHAAYGYSNRPRVIAET